MPLDQLATTVVNSAIERWRADLLDLSRKNRLLYFQPVRHGLTVEHPAIGSVFDDLAYKSKKFKVYQSDDEDAIEAIVARDQLELSIMNDEEVLPDPPRPPRVDEIVFAGEQKKVNSILYRFRLRARSALIEHGVSVLYLAFGTLEWTEGATSDESILSPLILVPVQLNRETALSPYELSPLDEDPILNPSLVRKLELDFQLSLTLPNSVENDLSLKALLDHVRGVIRSKRRWTVRDDASLGIFTFSKYAMYQDLEANRESFVTHPVIRMLAGDSSAFDIELPTMPSAESIDRNVHPREMFQVLDADASQLEAIEAVKRGTHLIIQGPPGTGKSQTITNIIAETLARKQTVLFVSEKMAALQVVANRLDAVGLKDFYLEAHSQDIRKAEVVRELYQAMTEGQSVVQERDPFELEQLAKLRRELNTYADQLHDTSNPLGLSAYQVHGLIASKLHAPVLHFSIDDVDMLSRSRIATMLDVVERLSQSGAVVAVKDTHPWRGCVLPSATPQVRSELESRLRQTVTAASSLDEAQSAIRFSLGLPERHSLSSAQWLNKLTALLQHQFNVPLLWMEAPSLDPIYALARDYRERATIYRRRRETLLKDYNDGAFSLDAEAITAVLTIGAEQFGSLVKGDQAPADRVVNARDVLSSSLSRVRSTLLELSRAAPDSSAFVGEAATLTISGLEQQHALLQKVLSDPHPKQEWFVGGKLAVLQEVTSKAIEENKRRSELRHRIAGRFDEALFENVTPELLQRFENAYASPTRALKIGYRKDIRRLKKHLRSESKLQYQDALSAIRDVLECTSIDEWFASSHAEWMSLFGPQHFHGEATAWTSIETAIRTTRSILDSVPNPPQQLVTILTHQSGTPAALEPLVSNLDSLIAESKQAIEELRHVIRLEDKQGATISTDFTPLPELLASIDAYITGLTSIWSAYDQVAGQCRLSTPSVTKLVAGLREAQEIRQLLSALDSDRYYVEEAIGGFFDGLETDWDAVIQALDWSGQIKALFSGPLPSAFVERLHDIPTPNDDWQSLKRDVRALDQQLESLRTAFDDYGFKAAGNGGRLDAVPLDELRDWANDKLQNLWRLEEWIDLSDTLESANQEGLSGFVEAVANERITPELWTDVFERQLYGLWLSWRYAASPPLSRFRGERHDDAVTKFRERDASQLHANSQRVRTACMAMRPNVPQTAHPTSEPGILRRDANRKRRFRPLRRLFADLPTLLPALKPCMLMSPLSVSQFLGDSPIQFDVVIFDEASQILPADALGAIARGKQIVIVGDGHQLPPTRFFRVNTDLELGDDEDEELPESILDACLRAGLPVKPLRWHYRSKHEDLIAFSNRTYYKDLRLVTFPSPDSSHRAVEFVHVPDGIFKDRHNTVEAVRVVNAIVDHVRRNPDQSLGVITFSATQEETIDHALNARKRLEPDLEQLLNGDKPDGFFVKNLENVQGDERDVILSSVGYGPDELGRMRMLFGPLTQKGGERRLNVAVTRARLHVKVFASFMPDAIDLRRTTAKGTKDLRSYLEFAIHGPIALDSRITSEGGDPESPFEEAVASALARQGLNVVTQIGVGGYRIDMAIRDDGSNQYLLGIECDGATYHSSQTARDRDRLRQSVLENLGWSIHRIWSTDWLKDPDREVQKVLTALDQSRHRKRTTDVVPSRPGSPTPDGPRVKARSRTPERDSLAKRPIPRPARHVSTTTANPIRYKSAVLQPKNAYYEFAEAPISDISRLVDECVQVESPVHIERVIKAVTEAYGVQRVREGSRTRMLTAIDAAIRRGVIERRDDFLWQKGSTVSFVRTENERLTIRPIDQIATEEIALAASQVLDRQYAMSRTDLAPQVARELGYNRTSGAIESRISNVINTEVANGTLRDIGGQISKQ